jgi:hypothetical protein
MIEFVNLWSLVALVCAAGGFWICAQFEDVLERRGITVATLAIFIQAELHVLGLREIALGSIVFEVCFVVSVGGLLAASYATRQQRRGPRLPRIGGDEIPIEFVTRPQVQREADKIAAWYGGTSAAVWCRGHGQVDARFTVSPFGYLLCRHLRAAAEFRRIAARYGSAACRYDVQIAVLFRLLMIRWIVGHGWQSGLEAAAGVELDKAQAKHMRGETP